PRLEVAVEVEVGAEDRQRGAVDRRERRAQLVGDGRDEVGLHRLDPPLLGQVAERVDDALLEADAGSRYPDLAMLELDREGERGEGLARPARDGDPLREPLPPGDDLREPPAQ